MESIAGEGERAAIEYWRSIVEAAWALNHINVGLRGMMPRLVSAKDFLCELEAIAPSIDDKAMIEIVEGELKAMANEFRKISEQLDARSGEINKILSLMNDRGLNSSSPS